MCARRLQGANACRARGITDTISVRCNFELPMRSGRSRTRFARFLAQAPLAGADLPRALDDRMEAAARVAGLLLRGRLRRPRLAERVRRRRAAARRADRRRPGARRRRRAGVRQRRRARRARPVAAALRQRRAAAALHPVDPLRRGDLVPGLLASPRPAPTSRRCARARSSTTTTSCSAARRPGSRGASTRAGAACSRAPRTTGPKHRGISMLIVDMRSAGRRACAR